MKPYWHQVAGVAFFALVAACNAQVPLTVQVTKPEIRDIERRSTFPAIVTAWQKVEMLPRVTGAVEKLHVDIGDVVKKDQPLIELSNPELEAELISAQADALEASATLKQSQAEAVAARADVEAGQKAVQLGAEQTRRLQTLQKAQSATAKEAEEAQKYHIAAQANIEQATAKLEVAKVKVQVAEARLQTMEARLEQVRAQHQFLLIKAPFDAVVTDRKIDVGAVVAPSTSGGAGLLTLHDNTKMRVVVDVPETEAPVAVPGTKTEITVPSLKGVKFSYPITRNASSLSVETKTLRSEIDVENNSRKLMDGMFANASIVLDTHKQVLSVPAKAVTTKAGNSSVLIVEGGKVKFTPISIGLTNGQWTEVKEGINAETDVIVSARDALGTGMQVKTEPAPSGDTQATSGTVAASGGSK